MKKIIFLLIGGIITIYQVRAQTLFEFETAVDNGGGNVTETISDITVTAQGGVDFTKVDGASYAGSSGNMLFSPSAITSVTFTFNQAVDVTSILAIEGDGRAANYTFTPIGGANFAVEAAVVPDVGTNVELNWTGVTSFTVTTSSGSGSYFAFDNLSVSPDTYIPPETLFDFETGVQNVDNAGGSVTETIDDITVTVTSVPIKNNNPYLNDHNGYAGSSGNAVGTGSSSLCAFTFNKAVNIVSILAVNQISYIPADYIFTPTPLGDNAIVVTQLVGGLAPPTVLNWENVESFTVESTSGASLFLFDNLGVNSSALSTSDDIKIQKIRVYPNPVEDIIYINTSSHIKLVRLFSLLGQEVLQSKGAVIDVSQLPKGMYLLQMHTGKGIETERIIKK